VSGLVLLVATLQWQRLVRRLRSDRYRRQRDASREKNRGIN
jgi:hypothetical protein